MIFCAVSLSLFLAVTCGGDAEREEKVTAGTLARSTKTHSTRVMSTSRRPKRGRQAGRGK